MNNIFTNTFSSLTIVSGGLQTFSRVVVGQRGLIGPVSPNIDEWNKAIAESLA